MRRSWPSGERELPRILEEGLGRRGLLLGIHRPGEVSGPGVPSGLQRLPAPEIQRTCASTSSSRCRTRRSTSSPTYRGQLFPGTPVVFFASGPATRPHRKRTGLIAGADLHGHARPGRRPAATGPPDLCRQRRGAGRPGVRAPGAAAIPAVRARFAITYLYGLPSAELESRLSSLPAALRHLLPARQSRRRGQNFHPLEYLSRLTRDRQRADVLLGRLGDGPGHRGRQPEGSDRAARRPRQACRSGCCRGESADSIPISSPI